MSTCQNLPRLTDSIHPFVSKSYLEQRPPLLHSCASLARCSKSEFILASGIEQLSAQRSFHSDRTASHDTPAPRARSIAPSGNSAAEQPSAHLITMQQRTEAARVTLPPLTALTASIIPDQRRHLRSPKNAVSHDLGIFDRPGPSHEDETLRAGLKAPSASASFFRPLSDRRHPADDIATSASRSISNSSHPPTSDGPHSHSSAPEPPSSRTARHLQVSPPSMLHTSRAPLDSGRPRAYSSPHRPKLPSQERRSSLAADHSNLDRLLDGLIYVQDINRRLGLSTGRPPSPSILRSSEALRMLRNNIQAELECMAEFSQSRAQSVAQHLEIPFSSSTFSSARRDGSSHQGTPAMMRPIDPRPPWDASWPAVDPAERPPSSLGRLTLEDQRREIAYRHPLPEREVEFEDGPSELRASGLSMHANHLIHHDPTLRSISRSASFEQPRAIQRRQADHSHYDHGTFPDSSRPGMEYRPPHDHSIQHAYAHGGPTYLPHAQETRQQQQLELLDRRRLTGKGMKRVRKRKNEHHQECLGCQAKETPEWRKGPMGPRTLCNACGLLYAKISKRKLQEAEAAAKATGRTAEEIVREREESPGAKQASLEALRAELNVANGARQRASTASFPATSTGVPYGYHLEPAATHTSDTCTGPSESTRPTSSGHARPTQPLLDVQPSRPPQDYDLAFSHERRPLHHGVLVPSSADPSGAADLRDLRPVSSSGMRARPAAQVPLDAPRRWADDSYVGTASAAPHAPENVDRFVHPQSTMTRCGYPKEGVRVASDHSAFRDSSPPLLSSSSSSVAFRRGSSAAMLEDGMYGPFSTTAADHRERRHGSPSFGTSSPSPPQRYRQLPPQPLSARRHHPYL
ncbi:uncharacterized protein PAN0_026c6159 [Moesziomyces antarcticus]|uniref:GATA-type domain-containing protein n=2 Tax=Pseudozyma antarctica TaxID=84753 RepID=A0A081CMN3_PSEA2|nr:uncharacterized protein PAN0_026c6159 [Moesziomyces antarcticus]GAK67929.1 hypothetical protein PAN0_026c6159 [Moesziomyces antarcticus]